MQAVIRAILVHVAESDQTFLVVDRGESAPSFGCDKKILGAAERVILLKLRWIVLGVGIES